MTDIELAYMAGIIDGEGSVGVYWRFAKDGTKRYVTPTVQVTNTDRRLLEWIQERWPGQIYPQRDTRPTRKPAWHWQVAGRKARTLIESVLPFMLLKTAQAQLTLSIHIHAPGEPVTPETFEHNRQVIVQIRALNRRGRASSEHSDAPTAN